MKRLFHLEISMCPCFPFEVQVICSSITKSSVFTILRTGTLPVKISPMLLWGLNPLILYKPFHFPSLDAILDCTRTAALERAQFTKAETLSPVNITNIGCLLHSLGGLCSRGPSWACLLCVTAAWVGKRGLQQFFRVSVHQPLCEVHISAHKSLCSEALVSWDMCKGFRKELSVHAGREA